MKININKTPGDYHDKNCEITKDSCNGKWCLKQNHPPITFCTKCQCYYCSKGHCIERPLNTKFNGGK